MKLTHKDALCILGCNVSQAFDELKAAYRKASMLYHPDRNPAGLEMMKLINAAWSALSDYVPGDGGGDSEAEWEDLGAEMNAALNAIIDLGLTIEICGSWIWVSGDTKPHREILKGAGYRFAPKKVMWSWAPAGRKTTSRGKYSMDDIRNRHGSASVNVKRRKEIAA